MKQLNSRMINGLPARVLDMLPMVALLIGLTVLPAVADDKGCSDASLKGDYAYSVNGTAIHFPPDGPLAILGKITLDGKGAFSGSVNGNIAGEIHLLDAPVTGTYSVASDCTGTLTTTYNPALTIHFNLVLVEGAKGSNAAELVSGESGPATGTLNPVVHSGRGERFSD